MAWERAEQAGGNFDLDPARGWQQAAPLDWGQGRGPLFTL